MGSSSRYSGTPSGLQAQAGKWNALDACARTAESLIYAGTVNPTMPVNTGPDTSVQMSCNVYLSL